MKRNGFRLVLVLALFSVLLPVFAATKNTQVVAEGLAQLRVGKTILDWVQLFDLANPDPATGLNTTWRANNFYPGTWLWDHQNDPLPPLEVNCAKLWDVAKKYVPIAVKADGHDPALNQIIGPSYGFYGLTDVWARGSFDADGVVAAWSHSLYHYMTVMSPFVTHVAAAQQSRVWVAVFASYCVP